ncbi:MAG: NAD(P)H-hydrate dehydratase [Mariprofundus sp.]|nr:NAD(P)H-hydrate dehydratase [Mariprofundus sp.]
MNTHILSVAQMSWADMQTIQSGTSGFDLMDRAGFAVAAAVLEHMPDFGRVVIVVGSGNNGGDGFAAAYYLRRRRLPVTVVLLSPLTQLSGDLLIHAERAIEAGAKLRETDEDMLELKRWLLRSVMVVDALFGTGLCRPLHGKMAEAVKLINALDRPVLSVDIASGLDADSGAVLGRAIQADFTLPIAACKWGYWMGQGIDYSGRLLLAAPIGIEEETLCDAVAALPSGDKFMHIQSACFIDEQMIRAGWSKRPHSAHKGDFGHVWIFGGSIGFAGAPQLSALGAFAAGAGLVSLVCPDNIYPVVAAGSLEVMVHPESTACWLNEDGGVREQVDVIVAGSGWANRHSFLLLTLLQASCPLLLDAEALNMLAINEELQMTLAERDDLTLLTPHPGEAARLLECSINTIQKDRRRAVITLSRLYRCWVMLKGSETLIASPQGDLMINISGSPDLAVAGSGDLLAGMLGRQMALCASKGMDVGVMLAAAVGLHGSAGEQEGWYLVRDLATVIAQMRQQLERTSPE